MMLRRMGLHAMHGGSNHTHPSRIRLQQCLRWLWLKLLAKENSYQNSSVSMAVRLGMSSLSRLIAPSTQIWRVHDILPLLHTKIKGGWHLRMLAKLTTMSAMKRPTMPKTPPLAPTSARQVSSKAALKKLPAHSSTSQVLQDGGTSASMRVADACKAHCMICRCLEAHTEETALITAAPILSAALSGATHDVHAVHDAGCLR